MRVAPPRGRCTTARNKYEKRCGSRRRFFLCFCISCFCILLCVAVRVVSCCLCNGAVVSYGGKGIVPLHYIYNMTNLSKNKKRFLKALGLRPAPQENVMKLYSAPLFGLIYNMLKNSESVTFFCKKNHPGFHRGNCQRKPQL